MVSAIGSVAVLIILVRSITNNILKSISLPTPETSLCPSSRAGPVPKRSGVPPARHIQRLGHHAGRHQRFRHHQLDQLRSFEDVRRPSSFRSISVPASASLSCSFSPISAAAKNPWAMAKQPGFAIAVAAPIDGNGFQAEVDSGEMSAGGDPGLAQDRRGQQPAEPMRMLQHRQFVPSIEGDDRLQHRRQVFGLAQHPTPLV